MIGLISFAVVFGWLAASIFIAAAIRRRIPATRKGVRWLAGAPLVAVLFLLPVGDMVIARLRIEYLCQTDPLVREVRFFGSIPGYGHDFYTPDGKWKSNTDRSIAPAERARLDRLREELVGVKPQTVIADGAIPMAGHDTVYTERRTGRLLASYRSYRTFDGFVLQRVLPGQPTSRIYCIPEDTSPLYIYTRIFPFASSAEAVKR